MVTVTMRKKAALQHCHSNELLALSQYFVLGTKKSVRYVQRVFFWFRLLAAKSTFSVVLFVFAREKVLDLLWCWWLRTLRDVFLVWWKIFSFPWGIHHTQHYQYNLTYIDMATLLPTCWSVNSLLTNFLMLPNSNATCTTEIWKIFTVKVCDS